MIVFKCFVLEFHIKNKPQIYKFYRRGFRNDFPYFLNGLSIFFNLDPMIDIAGNETIITYNFPVAFSFGCPV